MLLFLYFTFTITNKVFMKKIIPLSLSIFLFFAVAKSQTSLTVAKDFKAVDSRGVVHSLFNYLDNDKIVFLMFTSST
jgi:uncharacterized lipoprotein YajG